MSAVTLPVGGWERRRRVKNAACKSCPLIFECTNVTYTSKTKPTERVCKSTRGGAKGGGKKWVLIVQKLGG